MPTLFLLMVSDSKEEISMSDYLIKVYAKPEERNFTKQGTQTVHCEVTISNPDFVHHIKNFRPQTIAWNGGTIQVSTKTGSGKTTYTLSTIGDGRSTMTRNYHLLLRGMGAGLREALVLFLRARNLNPTDRLVFSSQLYHISR